MAVTGVLSDSVSFSDTLRAWGIHPMDSHEVKRFKRAKVMDFRSQVNPMALWVLDLFSDMLVHYWKSSLVGAIFGATIVFSYRLLFSLYENLFQSVLGGAFLGLVLVLLFCLGVLSSVSNDAFESIVGWRDVKYKNYYSHNSIPLELQKLARTIEQWVPNTRVVIESCGSSILLVAVRSTLFSPAERIYIGAYNTHTDLDRC